MREAASHVHANARFISYYEAVQKPIRISPDRRLLPAVCIVGPVNVEPHNQAGSQETALPTKYNNPPVGCYIDESAGSADRLNQRTIGFAREYGFTDCLLSGCFDGLELQMTLDDALSASHSGQCDDDVEWLASQPEIGAQLDKIGAEKIRLALQEVGAWDTEELADDAANRLRAVWQAACDIRENSSEQLSEIADSAVDFLNGLETRSYMSWTFEDNSLFLVVDVDGAQEDVGFVSSRHQDYPDDDYEGEWLHISDHGNCTLYVREKGEDREIWSVV